MMRHNGRPHRRPPMGIRPPMGGRHPLIGRHPAHHFGPPIGPSPDAFRGIRRHIMQANLMMDAGQYLDAAFIFEDLSEQLLEKGMCHQAANLAGRAASAYLLNDNALMAVEVVKNAVNICIENGQPAQAARLTRRAIAELYAQNYASLAEELHADVNEKLKSNGKTLLRHTIGTRPLVKLPTQCPACRGPVRTDDINWIDTTSAECAFCGNVIRGE